MDKTKAYHTDKSRWKAVSERDTKAENAFRYAVKTTGVYCRPGCTSRLPSRGNVEFFGTWQEAEAVGYRPCKRCAPDADTAPDRMAELMAQACRMIEQAATPPSLRELAESVTMSHSHFQRQFKRVVGVTPKQYAASQQACQFRNNLEAGMSVTDAMYSAGYSSSSRGYEAAQNLLSMKPGSYKAGASGETIRYGLSRCSLGWVVAAATEHGLCAVEFGDDTDALIRGLQERFPKAHIQEAGSEFNALLQHVVEVVDGRATGENLPLNIRGTAFQVQVWQALRGIRPGDTTTYSAIAERIGRPDAVRAVAGAVAANKLGVIIPCHRVLRKDGRLGGYRWGEERKRMLLEREAEPPETADRPAVTERE